ncbi:feruloyl-CoA synthase [Roseinatronobacter alkalisoli]|uniref:Feruloyl-CoA synthase n=1 Tax=Roseinatronobacter alkalisoli TaxID=3028235 RepID=A0ABT5TBG8_9RHOB|nr:feruloyl-CoA synthase [Roseinatronobacter sp. HJB301]MDD7972429.1 feruloyl-CoA synthase [Roseinatronobacter sp. HJB301]
MEMIPRHEILRPPLLTNATKPFGEFNPMTVQPPAQARFWSPEFEYEHRPDGTILMRQTDPLPAHMPLIADYLDKWADATPDNTWMARRDAGGDWRRISYAQARDMARHIGAALLGLGLGPDRPLLVLSENSLEHALLGLGCTYAGIPYAPVSPAYSLVSKDHGKLRDIVALLQPGAVFADDGAAFAPALQAIAAARQSVITLRGGGSDTVAFDDLLTADPAAADTARAALSPDTVVKYLFTSGSTGSPKAVINTNRMICAMAAMLRDCYRFLTWEPPVVLDWAPWNHTAAGNKVNYLVLTNGGTYYIDDGRPVPGKFDETLRNLREISCTWYFNVPVGYDMLIDAMEQDDALAQKFYAKLGMLFYAGAGMAQHTWDRLSALGRRVTGRDVLLATGLGATETAPFALACTDIQDKAGNLGVPSRGLTLKLVPSGDKLEARLKGPTITPGYFGDPARTADAFDEEGFYCLGDALRPADPQDLAKGFYFDGRVAENFKLSTGTWVSVGAVRAALVDAMGGLIRDAVIVGENQSELGALLLLSDKARTMPADELTAVLQDRLAKAAKQATGSASRVRRALVVETVPSFDKGEITEKGSLNQRAMRDSHAPRIAELFSDSDGIIRV